AQLIAMRSVAKGEGVGYGQRWIAERESIIGTVAIGYGDGYPRHAPNGTPVLVNGKRVPLAGRVSMDTIGIDLTDTPGARIGDKVTLWGPGLPAYEIASLSGTIAYELFTGVTARVPREYIGS
ncbi:MAG: alanine racemase C-terminal domain-containing protein, partial [bacterium]